MKFPRALSLLASVAILGCIAKLFTLVRLLPLNWDEAVYLQSVMLFATRGVYGTSTDDFSEISLFNPQLTTGPGLALPEAAFNFLFGFSIAGSRGVMLCFDILLVAGIFLLLKAKPPIVRWSAPAAVFVVPFLRDFGISILGEVPAVTYLLLALLFLSEWREALKLPKIFACGLLVGTALMTKYQTLIFFPAFLLEFLVVFVALKGQRVVVLLSSLLFLLGFLVPPITYLSVMYVATSGHGLTELLLFFQGFSGNSGLNSLSEIQSRAELLFGWAGIPLALFVLTLVLFPHSLVLALKAPYRIVNVMCGGWLCWWILLACLC